MCVYVCILSHVCVYCPVCGVIGDPGVTGEAALHDGIVVQVLLAVFHKTAHPQMQRHTHTHTRTRGHTQYYCISAANHKS